MTTILLLMLAMGWTCLHDAAAGVENVAAQGAMDFEVPGAWMTAPELLNHFEEEQLWCTRSVSFAELAGGLELSRQHVKSGEFSGKWSDHPRYPTVHCSHVPRDWSEYATLVFWAYSEQRTGERITLAAASDSDATVWDDYFLISFSVNWTGWQRLQMPLAEFEPYGSPAGWEKVDAVYFFTKVFDRQPNPYTVLYLDAMELLREHLPATPLLRERRGRPELLHHSQVPRFDPRILNHQWPEIRGGKTIQAPIRYQPYFRAERALFGYYPRFQPGFVSFSPDGRPYIQYGAYIIQTVDESGHWSYRNVLNDVLWPYAQNELGFEQLSVGNRGQTNDASIRFDGDGDAYMLAFVSDPTRDWRSRTGLLLHSRDGMETWDVYELPQYMARFEKFVGHNDDRLDRPPVILLSTYHGPTTNYILVPEKLPDGTLVIPQPKKIAEEAIPFIPHSGEANNAITVGDTVYIAYGKLTVLPGRDKEDGVPSYIVSYGLNTGNLSEPVLLGFGGINATDPHNWPALAIDSKGYFHVLLNGHHNPLVYVRSKRPLDITEWTEAYEFADGISYAGLVCDSEDTLYSVTRNSHPGYYFRLSLHRKKAGRQWEEPRRLVIPYKPYYKIWYHKLVLDSVTARLFLAYYAQSASICVFKDEYLAYLYTWPDREKHFLSGEDGPKIPLGTYCMEPRKYQFYAPKPSEPTILVSDDHGDMWHLATTEDFVSAPRPAE